MRALVALTTVLMAVSGAGASVLNWDGTQWPDGSLTEVYVVDGVTIRLTFTGNTEKLLTAADPPHNVDLPTDDHAWAPPGLWWACSELETGESLTLTIDFSPAVYGVTFNIYDIDGVIPAQEEVTVSASLGASSVTPTFPVVGAHINLAGNVLTSDGTFDSDPDSPDNTATVGLSGGDSVDQMVLLYTSIGTNRGELIGPITFVPEPVAAALLTMGGLAVIRRRRRRQ